ncbi:MAG: hypothetical protein ACHQ6U_01430 [Thermodesulfobacteriota bacterium]
METIGKVLSIVLLTIFGSAAATVYLVDSNNMPSFLGTAPAGYISDKGEPENDSKFFYDTNYRDREKYNYAEPFVESDDPEHYNDVKPIWGQTYDSGPIAGTQRARELAEGNSRDSLKKNMEYWKARYDSDVKSGSFRGADTAYRNYSEYKQALELKQP